MAQGCFSSTCGQHASPNIRLGSSRLEIRCNVIRCTSRYIILCITLAMVTVGGIKIEGSLHSNRPSRFIVPLMTEASQVLYYDCSIHCPSQHWPGSHVFSCLLTHIYGTTNTIVSILGKLLVPHRSPSYDSYHCLPHISFLRRALEEQTIQNTLPRRLPCPSGHRCCLPIDLCRTPARHPIPRQYGTPMTHGTTWCMYNTSRYHDSHIYSIVLAVLLVTQHR